MTDIHRRAAGSSRLSPEEIANRGFASAFRGISETEVRNFLRRIADEITAIRAREAELTAQIKDLREQLSNPTPVTEQELLSSLGEETARVLRSAQDAGEEIRKRAEERAAALVREAQEEAGQIREESQQLAAAHAEEAERRAAELEGEADARATQVRDEAEREAETLRERTTQEADELREHAAAAATTEIESAKSNSRDLVDEARTVRERVLADLGRRRSLLQAQVDELRSGRDSLLDAYRVVKRTLSDATGALAQVEARANTELAAPPAPVSVPPVEGELEVLQSAAEGTTAPGSPSDGEHAIEIDLEAESVVVVTGDGSDEGGGEIPAAEDSGAAVDALFARLRASHTTEPAPAAPAAAPEPTAAPGTEPEGGGATTSPEGGSAGSPLGASEASATDAEAPEESWVAPVPVEAPLSGDAVLRAERDEVLAPLARELTRRAKRALQDQQNEILDKIRTIKGRLEATEVLPALDEQESAWIGVLDGPLAGAYVGAFADLAGQAGKSPELPRELVDDLAHTMVEPWRQRLVSAIDGSTDDPDTITQRLGARYREYRGKELESALGDALAAAWARGAFDAVPDGTRLRWVPVEVGRCPDCDDNALEPTPRSEPFPTGQRFPPAHPGCRCFLVLAEPAPARK